MKTVKLCTRAIRHTSVVLICTCLILLGGCKGEFDDIIKEDGDVVYINDVILENVNYHEISYDKPTVLIFRNLQKATNSVYFHKCVNIKEVHFPKLVSIGEVDAINPYLYFHQNQGLEKVVAPKLKTVYGYLYFWGNSSLDLSTGICKIGDVYPRGDPDGVHCADPSVNIVGNANNDACTSIVLHFCD